MPGPIEEGQEFVDFAAFKVAMQDWAVGGAHKLEMIWRGRHPSFDPNARVVLSIENRDGTQRFQRIFVCPGISRSGFENFRHMIAMDGTFTKDIFSLLILLAACVECSSACTGSCRKRK